MGEDTPPPLLTLRDGLPPVIETEEALAEYCADLAAGTGPVAIDAERASGYRYSNRAYLIQVRRDGAGTALIDPLPFPSMEPLQEAIGETEWILHAATQDLPCLGELGLRPHALFDTELAGRLLDYPRVGLATLVETLLGARMKKEHSAVDWSTRPLPQPWLEYAALDVEVLIELRDALAAELAEAGKADWAAQEFEYLRGFTPPERGEGWRRTSGMHKVRGRRSLAAVRELWLARDRLAQELDVTPGRLVPDSAISAAARAMPSSRRALLDTDGFHGRGARRYAASWVEALRAAAEMPDEELPTRAPRGDGPPAPRAWAEKDPVAARRLELARASMRSLSQEHGVPPENLLTPDHLRRVMWAPPSTRDPVELLEAVIDRLAQLGARGWQIGLTGQALTRAVLGADAEAAAQQATRDDAAAQEPDADSDSEDVAEGASDDSDDSDESDDSDDSDDSDESGGSGGS